MGDIVDELITIGDVEQRDTLQEGATGDCEEVFAVGSGKTSVAFGYVCGDGG